MGFFDRLFGGFRREPPGDYKGFFQMLDGYTPVFTTRQGGVYESELVRAAINARATHISKLSVEITGAAHPALTAKLKHAPNEFQTWGQFLYRLSTILDINNTAFITPIVDGYGETTGIYSPLPTRCELVQYGDTPYLRYEFSSGQRAAIELERCGIMTKFQYRSDLFGESNDALTPTMDLIHIQNQGITEGVKNAASFRFWARVSNFSKPEDLSKERRRFDAENFSADAKSGGLLLFPNVYSDIHQVEAKPWVIDAEQINTIKSNVFNYYGVNDDILTNSAYGDRWSAFYEGVPEWFGIQFSDVSSAMLYSPRERSQGNAIRLTANRLQYMSNADKLNVSAQMLDRGIMSINDVREIWNLPPVEGGDVRIIRGEYYNATDKVEKNGDGDDGSDGADV